MQQLLGLSPRLRGNAPIYGSSNPPIGSIPALAGERRRVAMKGQLTWVYPRACGGTKLTMTVAGSYTGLSPRLRGNVNPALGRRQSGRRGLSPRLRGNGPAAIRKPLDKGSIPALAGERRDAIGQLVQERVYPRACGGTTPVLAAYATAEGLSPRLRGNAGIAGILALQAGSIPALAGERTMGLTCIRYRWVYPRACGGTHGQLIELFINLGLSPRLRGNAGQASDRRNTDGSIPALAGERRT